jgi:hypothetical protein
MKIGATLLTIVGAFMWPGEDSATNIKTGEEIPIYADDFRSTVSLSEYGYDDV